MTNRNIVPISFIGNKKLYLNLKNNFLNLTLPSSIIIYGDKGIGKTTFINYFTNQLFSNFAENLNKNNNSKHIPLIINNSHPNFMVITKIFDDKLKKLKNYINIDQIRILESFIYQSSIFNLPKIILINSADDLNINASNALLKILEEPKKNTFFFLISHQPSLLLPTIRSRCIKYKFNKPSLSEYKKIFLQNNETLPNNELELLYDISNGCPGVFLNSNSQNNLDTFDKIINTCKKNKILSKEIIELSTELNTINNDQFSSFLMIVRYILSNIIKIKLGIKINKNFHSLITKKIFDLSNYLTISNCVKTLDYLTIHENDLFRLNLDKKIFTINLFSELAS